MLAILTSLPPFQKRSFIDESQEAREDEFSFFLVHHVKPNSFVPNPLRRYTEGLSAS